MSIYMHLYSPDTKLMLWIGDWRNYENPFGFQLFGDEEEHRKLERFLAMHKGKSLQFLDDCVSLPDDGIDFEDRHWEEYVASERDKFKAAYGYEPGWQVNQ